ncbi:TPA: hypothetical protein ACQOJG_001711, partial [Streptococcus pyogenes]
RFEKSLNALIALAKNGFTISSIINLDYLQSYKFESNKIQAVALQRHLKPILIVFKVRKRMILKRFVNSSR